MTAAATARGRLSTTGQATRSILAGPAKGVTCVAASPITGSRVGRRRGQKVHLFGYTDVKTIRIDGAQRAEALTFSPNGQAAAWLRRRRPSLTHLRHAYNSASGSGRFGRCGNGRAGKEALAWSPDGGCDSSNGGAKGSPPKRKRGNRQPEGSEKRKRGKPQNRASRHGNWRRIRRWDLNTQHGQRPADNKKARNWRPAAAKAGPPLRSDPKGTQLGEYRPPHGEPDGIFTAVAFSARRTSGDRPDRIGPETETVHAAPANWCVSSRPTRRRY